MIIGALGRGPSPEREGRAGWLNAPCLSPAPVSGAVPPVVPALKEDTGSPPVVSIGMGGR